MIKIKKESHNHSLKKNIVVGFILLFGLFSMLFVGGCSNPMDSNAMDSNAMDSNAMDSNMGGGDSQPVAGYKVYADSGNSSSFTQLTISNGYPKSGSATPGANYDPNRLLVTKFTSGGADGSDNYINLKSSNANFYIEHQWYFDESFNGTRTNTVLKFSIRSTNTNITNILVEIQTREDAGGFSDSTTRVPMSFVADGTWQEMTYSLTNPPFLRSRLDVLSNIGRILFRLEEYIGENINFVEGHGVYQSIDLDEVRFEFQ